MAHQSIPQPQDRAQRGFARRTLSWRSSLRLLSVLLTTAASVAVLAMQQADFKARGRVPKLIADNQASTQLMVQFTAGILGAIQVGVVCEMVDVAIRRQLRQCSMRLITLHFWVAIVHDRLDWNVTPRLLALVVVFVILTTSPSALWPGAIAPLDTVVTLKGDFIIPSYTDASYSYRDGKLVQTQYGDILEPPGTDISYLLLGSAASASTPDGSMRNHTKLVAPTYIYNGRSYGVGSAVGPGADPQMPPGALYYVFNDTGLYASVSCVYNTSMGFGFYPSEFYHSEPYLHQYYAGGDIAGTGAPAYFTVPGWYATNNTVLFGVTKNVPATRHVLGIIAGVTYASLKQVQCTVTFTPATFMVNVSTSSRSINVQPITEQRPDFQPIDGLPDTVMHQFNWMNHQLFGWDVSPMGEALNRSINDYKRSPNGADLSPLLVDLAVITRSIVAIMDDLLLYFASARLDLNASRSTSAQFSVPAVKFGEAKYIYTDVALNTGLISLLIYQAVSTNLRSNLLEFDCLDARSIITTSSKGRIAA